MRKFLLLLSFCTFFSACETEDIQSEEQLLPLKNEPGRQILDVSDFKNPYVRDNLKFDLNKSALSANDLFQEYSTNLHTELENSYNTIFEKYHILSLQNPGKGEDKNILIKFISSAELDGVTLAKMEETNFTGTVIYYNRLGEAAKTEVYENGKESTRMKNHLINNSVKYAPADPCLNCYVLMHTINWVDWYNGYTMEYTHSQYQSITSEWVYVGAPKYQPMPEMGEPYHNHYDYPHGPSINRNNHADEILIDEKIYDFPCLTKVLGKILSTDNNLVMETINQFCNNPKFDLKFTIGECNNTENACTDGSSLLTTGEVRIIIEDPTQNSIDLAAMILHEGIHAEIFRFVAEHHQGNVDPNDKPQLFEYFKHYAGTEWDKDIDHVYMTQFYINPIAEALRQLDHYQYPLNYYKTYAWDGLRRFDPNNSLGITDIEYDQYRNEMAANFKIKCEY